MPRRNVRRGRRHLGDEHGYAPLCRLTVTTLAVAPSASGRRSASETARCATMPEHERREPVVAARRRRARSRGRPACRGTRGRGRARRSAASRSACATNTLGPLQQRLRAAPTTPSTCVPSASCARRVDRRAGLARAPRADGVEVLEREAERVHHACGSSRTPGWRGARSIRSRIVCGVAPRLVLLERRHVRAAAAAAACRAGSRASTCRARPATCGRRAT